MSEWQPIETMPDTGDFLAWSDHQGQWVQVQKYDERHGGSNVVINRMTGRFWRATKWASLPSDPVQS